MLSDLQALVNYTVGLSERAGVPALDPFGCRRTRTTDTHHIETRRALLRMCIAGIKPGTARRFLLTARGAIGILPPPKGDKISETPSVNAQFTRCALWRAGEFPCARTERDRGALSRLLCYLYPFQKHIGAGKMLQDVADECRLAKGRP